MEGITAFIFVGGGGKSDVEQALEQAHRTAARDLIETLLPLTAINRVIVATDDYTWAATLADLPVTVDYDPPGEPFHFGRRLTGLIEKYRARRILYSGGGSAPLFTGEQWAAVLDHLTAEKRLLITNNPHSSDWLGLTAEPDLLPIIARERSDNGLAWSLAQEGGLPVVSPSASAATRFDLDTPADLLIAGRHPAIGSHLRTFLSGLHWDTASVVGLRREMSREGGSLAVIGRASATAWRQLEQNTHCWVRLFAEERGMRASGRQARGEVRSLLADHLALVGVEKFFAELASLVGGVLFDNRVLLAARRSWPSAADRFNADLFHWWLVKDPFLRRFSRAASEAGIPILLGGHSVVSGGLMALVESLENETSRPEFDLKAG